ncbi:lytic murein transglycosylase [Desulfobacterota bacterium M19]
MKMKLIGVVMALCLILGPGSLKETSAAALKAADMVKDGQAINLASPRYTALFEELVTKYKFTHTRLLRLFYGVKISRRVLELMDKQYEALPYYKYYPIFVNQRMIDEGRRMLILHRALLDRIEKEIGVDRQIVVSVWGMESRYGRHQGRFKIFQTLNTMFDAYPRRRAFYRQQLISYLLLCRENKVNPLSISGSYGAAFGQTQFIPSSFREYAVDFDHDGRRDVWNSVPDVLASIANYLHHFHWTLKGPVYADIGHELKAPALIAAYKKGRKGLVPWQQVRKLQQVDIPPAPHNGLLTIVGLELPDNGMRYVAGYPNFQAITKWNNSNRYAMAVSELARRLMAPE